MQYIKTGEFEEDSYLLKLLNGNTFCLDSPNVQKAVYQIFSSSKPLNKTRRKKMNILDIPDVNLTVQDTLRLREMNNTIKDIPTHLVTAEDCVLMFEDLLYSLYPGEQKSEYIDIMVDLYRDTMDSTIKCPSRMNNTAARAQVKCALCKDAETNCIIKGTLKFKHFVTEEMRKATLKRENFDIHLNAVYALTKIIGLFYGVTL